TSWPRDWSSDVCSSDLPPPRTAARQAEIAIQRSEARRLGVTTGCAIGEGCGAGAGAGGATGCGGSVAAGGLTKATGSGAVGGPRSEERRVGKEWTGGW